MFRHHISVFIILSFMSLAACDRRATPPPPPPAPEKPATPVAPPKMATMICKNSQTGASVECGTPNAVMVGIKEN